MVFKAFKKDVFLTDFYWCTTLELELTLKEIERKIKSYKMCFLSWKSQIPALGTSKQLIRIIKLLKNSLIRYYMHQIGISCSVLYMGTSIVTKSICASLHSPFQYSVTYQSDTPHHVFGWTWKGNQHFWMSVALTPIIGCTVQHGCD